MRDKRLEKYKTRIKRATKNLINNKNKKLRDCENWMKLVKKILSIEPSLARYLSDLLKTECYEFIDIKIIEEKIVNNEEFCNELDSILSKNHLARSVK